mmetsp:Transcript_4527/g.9706  ORF Transcript_4527/g.9706 Transcript_4527/m.9706 type:complete len:242 (+) Transcript_4527:5685-6410(+)
MGVMVAVLFLRLGLRILENLQQRDRAALAAERVGRQLGELRLPSEEDLGHTLLVNVVALDVLVALVRNLGRQRTLPTHHLPLALANFELDLQVLRPLQPHVGDHALVHVHAAPLARADRLEQLDVVRSHPRVGDHVDEVGDFGLVDLGLLQLHVGCEHLHNAARGHVVRADVADEDLEPVGHVHLVHRVAVDRVEEQREAWPRNQALELLFEIPLGRKEQLADVYHLGNHALLTEEHLPVL